MSDRGDREVPLKRFSRFFRDSNQYSPALHPVAYSLYEGVSKIFLTDAVKIVKLIIRPMGHHHPGSSYLPQVDTGPNNSSIFGTLPGSPFLSECQARSWISSMISNRRPFSFNFIFGNRKKSQGVESGEYGGWGMRAIWFFARNCWVRTEV
jgi:hypothetical protein